MPKPLKPNPTPPPIKIADWPWWLEPEYVVYVIITLAYLSRLYRSFLWGRFDRMLIETLVFAACIIIYFTITYFTSIRDYYYPSKPERPKSCLSCGYDLRTTPLRCPECGTDTPFKHWLDNHPLDRLIYEKRLTPHKTPQKSID